MCAAKQSPLFTKQPSHCNENVNPNAMAMAMKQSPMRCASPPSQPRSLHPNAMKFSPPFAKTVAVATAFAMPSLTRDDECNEYKDVEAEGVEDEDVDLAMDDAHCDDGDDDG